MTIALIAHDSKKELMVQFCMAYRHILEQHRLLATGTTGRLVEENAGLKVTKFLPGGDIADLHIQMQIFGNLTGSNHRIMLFRLSLFEFFQVVGFGFPIDTL